MEEGGTWSAGSLRLVPYTHESLARQENRCRSAEARREEHGFRRERTTNLPERECVCIAPDLLPSKIFYTPLEDIGQFGLDKTFCVIAKRSSSYYLYRYSAEDSLFLFSPWSIVRRFAIRISCHRKRSIGLIHLRFELPVGDVMSYRVRGSLIRQCLEISLEIFRE
ncbi:sodium channel protein [Nephila pilipes]|uniref:Sodium channel protein n=1 Tax=Nephila pilipes TaxID=299642 RepID=A0A8X6QKQ1_NEPPI|nr:sodium channel protein [Nephila pilipes]